MGTPPEACLYALLYADRQHHEAILNEFVTPVVREIRGDSRLESLFFARYNEPRWQVRFRVLGRPEWVEGPVREMMAGRLDLLRERGLIEGFEFAAYQREYDRYGGVEGMRLAEKIFLHDTLACLDLIEAERRGELSTSRREFSLAMTERFLDLMKLEGPRRVEFYRFSYRWAIDMKTWGEEELGLLDAKYRQLEPGLRDLFYAGRAADAAAYWGGAAPARIADDCLRATRPVIEDLLEAHAAGRIRQDLAHLAWSYTHMHCNRLGIDPTPEAILRYLMHRLRS